MIGSEKFFKTLALGVCSQWICDGMPDDDKEAVKEWYTYLGVDEQLMLVRLIKNDCVLMPDGKYRHRNCRTSVKAGKLKR